MRARILLRVSTDRQAKARTVDAQRPPVRALAARLGAGEIFEYVEQAVSGAAPLDERDVLRRLLAEAEPGDLVCAFDLSRLTRSDDWIERYTVLGHLRRAGLRPATVEDGEIDLATVGGRITTHIRGEIAADERKKILDRVTAGKREAAVRGQKPQGVTPFGLRYDRIGKAWSLDEEQAAIVRGIYARILAGETCGQIATMLCAFAAPHPRSLRWSSARVWRLATRPVYRGAWSFEGRAIPVPAIVEPATWQAVQSQLLAAGRRGLRRTQHAYLLDEGAGRCTCGGELRIRWGGIGCRTSYYTCAAHCGALGWRRTEAVDAEVWTRILAALRRPDLVERALAGEQQDQAAGEGDAAGYERQLERLADVEAAILARFRRGTISEAGMDRELAVIARERGLVEQSAVAARESARRARRGAEALAGLREAVDRIAASLEAADAVERRETVCALRPAVEVSRDAIAIRFRLQAPAMAATPIALVRGTCSWSGSHCATENLESICVVA